MEPRVDYGKRFPELRQAMWAVEHYVHRSGLDPKLLELVKLRASLINGCAYCVDMHTKVARSLGETEQRLYAVSLWREAPFYSERERAALAWTEAVTLVSIENVPDDVYEAARQHFDEKELVDLTAAVVAINGWNRMAIAFRTVPGTFQIGRPAVRRSRGVRDESRTTKGSGPVIALKRAYEPVSRTDGTRFLVERLWPRGLTKAKLHVEAWLKGGRAQHRAATVVWPRSGEVGRVPQTVPVRARLTPRRVAADRVGRPTRSGHARRQLSRHGT
jgi:AhpD family alkylhydroperoxidase